tara:strand:- start:21 stop:443 length:423 start_codon:yes stop_codon:yes gene_type:complete
MTKMKKETMNHDREIDDFLKCNHENIDFKWEDQKLATEIKTKAKRSRALINFSRFVLPLAACLVAALSWVMISEQSKETELSYRTSVKTDDALLLSDLPLEDIELIDEWLLASPVALDLFSVDYDSSYELLVSLETIPMP